MENENKEKQQSTEQQTQPQTPKAEHKTMAEKAVERFSEMMVSRLEEMKGQQWEKGWIDSGGKTQGLPQNLSGRRYSGHNDFFLQLHTAMNGYQMPVYATFKQIHEAGATINKGEKAMPVIYWNITHKDENGQKVSDEQFDAMTKAEQEKCKTIPLMMGYYCYNLDQTNFKEVKPEQYARLQEQFKAPEIKDSKGMFISPEFDAMIEKQAWVCKINTIEGSGAFYSKAKDEITVPLKAQFNIHEDLKEVYKDGMEYYSSLVHEMAHSTGIDTRLSRDMEGRFGDKKYAKEELVAELSAAMVGNTMGFDKRILDNNAKYVDSWIDTLKQEPKFIISVMADVSKASGMILDHVDKQRLELGMSTLQSKESVLDEKGQTIKDGKESKVEKPLTKAAIEREKNEIDFSSSEREQARPQARAEEKAEIAKEAAHVWHDLKEKHPDAVLLMRKGDFYEAFGEDAKKVAKSTGLKEQHVVKEGFEAKDGEKGVSYVNFKNTSLDKYLPKLVRDGHRVAIVDNLEDMAKDRLADRKKQEKSREQPVAAKQTAAVAKTIPLDQFNKLETDDGKKIDHFAVFRMKSGNYGVRAMVDGQQLSVKPLQKEDRNAFFDHTTSKAALVQKYYGKELSESRSRSQSRAMGM